MKTFAEVLAFLFEHADLIEELYSALREGTPKDALKALIRRAKGEAWDAATRAALGLPPEAP